MGGPGSGRKPETRKQMNSRLENAVVDHAIMEKKRKKQKKGEQSFLKSHYKNELKKFGI